MGSLPAEVRVKIIFRSGFSRIGEEVSVENVLPDVALVRVITTNKDNVSTVVIDSIMVGEGSMAEMVRVDHVSI